VERGYTGICSIADILQKNCSPRKISLKSANQLLNYGQKTIFKMAAVRHLEFYGSNNGFIEKPM